MQLVSKAPTTVSVKRKLLRDESESPKNFGGPLKIKGQV